ncbi:hypothetical protein [Chryseobacterium jejuense]|uniref:hypothetical protein n=1 Tax=Chryseobacterium jejuense TaxID=445960 RepID=UPI001AE53394|nr:hypothetical protein [Chryseobacterium jejuense]MBP2619247.1 hypothetical protein [Chryseobacterium jejuense]
MKKQLLTIISLSILGIIFVQAQISTPNGVVGSTINSTTGNVGIGTNNPSHLLTAEGNGQFDSNTSTNTPNPLNVSLGGTYRSNIPGSNSNLKLDLYFNKFNNRSGFGVSDGLVEYQATTRAGRAFFVNDGTIVMDIISNGNIGIGTSAPEAIQMPGIPAGGLLWLKGKNNNPENQYINFRNPAVYDNDISGMSWRPPDVLFGRYKNEILWSFKETHGSQLGEAIVRAYIGDVQGYQYFNKFVIAPDKGNVGIGTSNPSSKLEITSGVTNDCGLNLTSASTTTPNTKLLSVDAQGKVILTEGSEGSLGNSWNLTGNIATDPAANFIGTTDNQPFVFKTNNDERMRITADGKLGLGTSNFSCTECSKYKLFVKDGISAEKVKVDITSANGWTDYVFKKTIN